MANAHRRRFQFTPSVDRLDLRIAPTGGNPMGATLLDSTPPTPPAAVNPMDCRLLDTKCVPPASTTLLVA